MPGYAQAPLPVGENFVISENPVYALGGKPAIASDGINFLVVWGDSRDLGTNGPDIYGARVAPDGTVLDPGGFPISTFANQDPSPGAQYVPSVAFDGTNYLVVWVAHRPPDSDFEVYAARVTPGGTVLDPGGIPITSGASPLRMPSIAFDGTNYLVTWRTASSEIRAARVTPAGVNLDGATGFFVGNGFYPYVAFDGTNYMIIWHGHGASDLDIFGARVSTAGSVLGGFTVSDDSEDQDHASIAFDGTNYLVVWGDHRRGNTYNGTTFGARVSPAGTLLDDPSFKIADYSLSGAASGTGDALIAFDGTDHFVAWNVMNIPDNFRLWDAYGARVSKGGTVLDQQAIPIATSFGHQLNPVIGYFGDKYLLAWSDNAGRCVQICAQLLQKQAYTAPSPAATTPKPLLGAWTAQGSPTGAALHAIWGFDKTHVYAVSEEDFQRLFRFDGTQWSAVANLDTAGRKFGLWGFGPEDVWTVGWCWKVVNYDGTNVNETGCLDFFMGTGIWGTSDTNILMVGVGGDIFRYDGGPGNLPERWLGMASPVQDTVNLHDVWGSSANNVYAVGEFGTIIRFNGAAWSKVAGIPTIQSLNGVWGPGANDIFAVGDFGTILHYNGASWSAQYSGTTEHLSGVFGLGPKQVFAVGFNGTLLRYDGKTWSPDTSGTTASLEDVWGIGDTVWAVGDSGVILRLVLPDSDGDGVTDDIDNCPTTANADQANNDGDSIGNLCDPDDDNDGMIDSFELANGFDPFDPADASQDADGDGFTNLKEFKAGSDPHDPESVPRSKAMPWLELLLQDD
jgi:hypothetical protein